MKQWDGNFNGYKYDTQNSNFIYFIDVNNTVYYRPKDDPTAELKIWCSGSELQKHLHHLEQIKAR